MATATKTSNQAKGNSAKKHLEAYTFITEDENGMIKSFFFEFNGKSENKAECHITLQNEGTMEYYDVVLTTEFKGEITDFLSSSTIPFTLEDAPVGIQHYSYVEIFKFDDQLDHAELVADLEYNLPRLRFEITERA